MYERQYFHRQNARSCWSKPGLKPLAASADEIAAILQAEDPEAALADFYLLRREGQESPSGK